MVLALSHLSSLVLGKLPILLENLLLPLKINNIASPKTVPECKCPKRLPPPPLPTELPFPATEEHREDLRKCILEYYRSSTFNVCEHQQLPFSDGPPLTLNIKPDAIPVAIHTPIPVPLHWQDEVKASLGQRCASRGIGTCTSRRTHHLVPQNGDLQKKKGKLRRTVDLQALNAYSTRETHYTQSPFHQATLIPANKKKMCIRCLEWIPLRTNQEV